MKNKSLCICWPAAAIIFGTVSSNAQNSNEINRVEFFTGFSQIKIER